LDAVIDSYHASAPRRIGHLAGLLMVSVIAGCGIDPGLVPPPDNGPTTDVIDGNRDALSTGMSGKTSGEPNGSFSQAIVALFDEEGIARLQGTVADVGDLDVFVLGPLSPGDRVIVDADTTGSLLDISVAIFDTAERLVYNNDDRGGSSARFLDSYIEWVVRHGGDPYYLVVTHSAFAGRGGFTGTYEIDVKASGGSAVPGPVGQALLLDFDGAVADFPTLGLVTLDPFDAAAISPIYRGETETVKETIRAVFEQNFGPFDVDIWTTDDPPPSGTQFSTVYFGGFDAGAFGIAEDVDLYNVDFCDDAIIFTESFGPQIFAIVPAAVELGIAIGNVGSHEAGHLVGLNHVDDDRALMDDQSVADAFIEDQEFMEAPLSSDIMSIGTQDAVLLLNEIVGLRPDDDPAQRMGSALFTSHRRFWGK
jgi:hypothetical protein